MTRAHGRTGFFLAAAGHQALYVTETQMTLGGHTMAIESLLLY